MAVSHYATLTSLSLTLGLFLLTWKLSTGWNLSIPNLTFLMFFSMDPFKLPTPNFHLTYLCAWAIRSPLDPIVTLNYTSIPLFLGFYQLEFITLPSPLRKFLNLLFPKVLHNTWTIIISIRTIYLLEDLCSLLFEQNYAKSFQTFAKNDSFHII